MTLYKPGDLLKVPFRLKRVNALADLPPADQHEGALVYVVGVVGSPAVYSPVTTTGVGAVAFSNGLNWISLFDGTVLA